MTLPVELEAILADPRWSDDTNDFSQADAIEGLIPIFGWPAVCDAVLDILAAERSHTDYEIVAQVIWRAIHEKRLVPADRAIALLYFRLDPKGDREDNLVWSITSELRGVDYLSDYKPLEDPKILAELAALQRIV